MPRFLIKSFFEADDAELGQTIVLRAEPMSAANLFPRPAPAEVKDQPVYVWKSKENVFWGRGIARHIEVIHDDASKSEQATATYTTWRIAVELTSPAEKQLHPKEIESVASVLEAARHLALSLKQPFDKIVSISDEAGALLDLLLRRTN